MYTVLASFRIQAAHKHGTHMVHASSSSILYYPIYLFELVFIYYCREQTPQMISSSTCCEPSISEDHHCEAVCIPPSSNTQACKSQIRDTLLSTLLTVLNSPGKDHPGSPNYCKKKLSGQWTFIDTSRDAHRQSVGK